MPEFRQDPITGRCVIIASNRAKRPRHHDGQTEFAYSLECPFCEGNEHMTPPEIYAQREAQSVKDTPGWLVRAFPTNIPRLKMTVAGTKPIEASTGPRRELVSTK